MDCPIGLDCSWSWCFSSHHTQAYPGCWLCLRSSDLGSNKICWCRCSVFLLPGNLRTHHVLLYGVLSRGGWETEHPTMKTTLKAIWSLLTSQQSHRFITSMLHSTDAVTHVKGAPPSTNCTYWHHFQDVNISVLKVLFYWCYIIFKFSLTECFAFINHTKIYPLHALLCNFHFWIKVINRFWRSCQCLPGQHLGQTDR